MSHLFAADGSLLSVIELVPHLEQNPGDGHKPKNFLKRDMYHLPLGDFPAQEQYNLPSLPCPWAGRISGNRPFNRTPSTKGTVGLHARDYTGTGGKSQFRSVLFFWKTYRDATPLAGAWLFCAFPALKQGLVSLFQKRKGAGWYPISPEIDTPQNRDRYPIRRRYTSTGQQAGQDLPRCGDMAPPDVLTNNRTYVTIHLQSNIVEAGNTAGRYGCAKCPKWTLSTSVTKIQLPRKAASPRRTYIFLTPAGT